MREQLPPQVALERLAVAHQQHRRRVGELFEPARAVVEPVGEHVPDHERPDEDHALGEGAIAVVHRVLRGVGDDHDQEHVGDADCADVPPHHEAEQQEQEPVHHRPADRQLEDRFLDAEELLPVELEHFALPTNSAASPGP
jgi:hypothetical protein